MPVCSYYCAACGVRLTPEQARFGRPALEDLDWYCLSCASELEIEPVDPGATGAGAAPRRASGRAGRPGPSGSGRIPCAPGPDRPAGAVPEPSGRRAIAGPALVCAALVVGAAAALMIRTSLGPVEGAARLPASAAASGAGEVAATDAAALPASPSPAAPPSSPPPPAPPRPAAASAPASAAQPPADTPSGPFVGTSSSHTFHRPSCKFAARIRDANKVTFATYEDAVREKFKPCKLCLEGGRN